MSPTAQLSSIPPWFCWNSTSSILLKVFIQNSLWYENRAHDSYWKWGKATFQIRCATRSRAFYSPGSREAPKRIAWPRRLQTPLPQLPVEVVLFKTAVSWTTLSYTRGKHSFAFTPWTKASPAQPSLPAADLTALSWWCLAALLSHPPSECHSTTLHWHEFPHNSPVKIYRAAQPVPKTLSRTPLFLNFLTVSKTPVSSFTPA